MGIPAQPPTVDPRSAPDAARAGARARPGRARRDGAPAAPAQHYSYA